MKWISIDKESPGAYECVILFTDAEEYVMGVNIGGQIVTDATNAEAYNAEAHELLETSGTITHWAKLPEPPEAL